MYDLLIDLLGNAKRIIISSEDQMKFLKALTVLKIIVSNMKTDITVQSEEQKKIMLAEQQSFWNNAEALLEKRN